MGISSRDYCIRYVAVFLLVTIGLAGCAGLGGRLAKPKVQLASLAVQNIQAFESTFVLTLRVFNTNDAPLDLKALEAELDLNGRHFATGVTRTDIHIPALESQTVDVTVYASSLEMVRQVWSQVQGIQNREANAPWEYTVSGTLHLDNRGLLPRLPFEVSGTVELDALGPKSQ